MSDDNQVLSAEQLRRRYGTFYAASPTISIDPVRVPETLHRLIPYAGFWGISDDWARDAVVSKAPRDIRQNLKEVVAAFDDELDDWLAGDEAHSPAPSQEYIAFSAMRMAADFV